MEFYRMWRILMGHKWLVIGLPVSATIFGLGLAYLLPEQYESTALILARPFEDIKFEPRRGEYKEIRDYPVTLSAPIDAPSKTYMEVIKSPAVAIKIVEALKLYIKKPKENQSIFDIIKDSLKAWMKSTLRTLKNYAKYGRDIPATPFELAVEDMDNLTVSARKDTYAFDISYRAGDPQEAAAVANMAAEIFLEHSSQAFRSDTARTEEFFQGQLEESRKALETARRALLDYKRVGDTFELTAEYNEKLKVLTDLQDKVASVKGKLAAKHALLGNKYNTLIVSYEGEISELEGQIARLREQLTAYPQKEKRLNVLLLQEKIALENYEFFVKSHEEARLKLASTAPEISITSHAVPPLYPIKPIKWIYAAIAFATALTVALAWALLSDAFRPRVRTEQDLKDELGESALGTLPSQKELKALRSI